MNLHHFPKKHHNHCTLLSVHTAATAAAAAEHCGGGFAVCTASAEFSTGSERIQGPTDSFFRGGASHLHNWAADFFQISAAGQRQVSGCQEGVLPYGERRHSSAVEQAVIIAAP